MKIPNREALKRFSLLLFAVLASVFVSAGAAFAASYSDTEGHWGAAAIDKWSDYDVLQGDGDGGFAPDRAMSVAELATVLSKTFGYTEVGNPAIASAVPAWAQEDVKKAVTAGVIAPDETGLTLTRELAAKILAKALSVAPVSGATRFADSGAVSASYRPYVNALGQKGVFKGDPGGNFMPQKGFTRAEVMQVFENTVTDIVREGKAAASEKSVIVNVPNLTLAAGTVRGDLIIGQGVGDGDLTLTDVKIDGRLIVYGGGKNSIYIKGESVIPRVVTQKTFGTPARLVVDTAASVGTVSVVAESAAIVAGDVAKLEVVPAETVSSSGEVASALPVNETSVEVASGTVSEISIEAAGAAVTLSSGATVTSLVVSGAGAEVTVAAGATVAEATVAASDVAIAGAGKLENVTVTADSGGGVAVTVAGAEVKNESGADVSAGTGKTIDAGKTDSVATTPSGGGGGGGGGSNTPAKYTVTFYDSDGVTALAGIDAQSVTSGGKATKPADPTKTDYVFADWYSDSALTTTFDFDAAITADTSVYAGWTVATYTLTVTYGYGVTAGTGDSSQVFAQGADISGFLTAAFTVTNSGTVYYNGSATAPAAMPGYDLTVKIEAYPTLGRQTSAETYRISEAGHLLDGDGDATAAYAVKVYTSSQGADDAAWYVADSGIAGIFKAVYEPNKENAAALALFHITLGANADDDLIELKGTAIPAGTIHIGIPDADISDLPDFVIGPGELGADGNDYLGAILQVNKGAYLNINSDQTFANAFIDSSYSAGTAGKFQNGSVYVMAGGKVRDSAYKAWPLGAGSVFTVYSGGCLAVGPGTRGGAWKDDAVDSSTSTMVSGWYDGWLIGSGGKVEFDGAIEGIDDPCIVVTNTSVALKGSAAVKKHLSLMYDLWLTAGSQLTVAEGAELAFIHGENDNKTTAKKIYGQPETTGGLGAGEVTRSRSASKVIVNGTIQSYDTNNHIFGGSTGQTISSATYNATGVANITGPVNNWGSYTETWTAATSQGGGGGGN